MQSPWGAVYIGITAFVVFATSAMPANDPPHSGIAPAPRKLGTVSVDGVISIEDVKPLVPELKHGLQLLRSQRFHEAQAAFRETQRKTPQEALAYRGDTEASSYLGSLDATISRYRKALSDVRAGSAPQNRTLLGVLSYALGDALLRRRYNARYIGDNPQDLGLAPEQHLLEAVRLAPDLLVAHLALAAYYEHPSQSRGTLARKQYDMALRLRPDLYQIRYLHAATWDRPGIVLNEAALTAQGFSPTEDQKKHPEKAIAECLALIEEYPNYSLPYYRVGNDYLWPIGNKAKARQYLSAYLKLGDPESAEWKRANRLVNANQ